MIVAIPFFLNSQTKFLKFYQGLKVIICKSKEFRKLTRNSIFLSGFTAVVLEGSADVCPLTLAEGLSIQMCLKPFDGLNHCI